LNKSETFVKNNELFQRDFYSNPFKKEITETKLPVNNDYECFTKHELNLRIKEKILKSAGKDTLLIDSLYQYTFRTPNDSTLTEKLFYNYNPQINQCVITKCNWDTIIKKWNFISKEDYYYDQNGNDTLMVLYNRNVDDNWTFNRKYVTAYDLKNRMISRSYFLWHSLTQKWWGQNKQVFEFDDYGNKTLEAYYTWSDVRNKWQGSSKSEYSFDNCGLPVLLITYQWDLKLFDWVGTAKEEYTYNKHGIQISETNSEWNNGLKDWSYVNKIESETIDNTDGRQYYYAYYEWENIFNRWKGIYKTEFFINNSDLAALIFNYIWNVADAKWEATKKTVLEMNESERSYKYNIFSAMDSTVTGEIIKGFNSESEFSNIWITSSCPDQTCTKLDSERVEGDASILWNYNINGNFYSTGGFCQVQMNTDNDMSLFSGLSFNCKVLTPSEASFILRLTETSGEVWMFENTHLLSDSSEQWQQIVFPFSEVIGTGTFIDGIFDNRNIKNIQLRLNVPKGIKTTGSVLIDNLSSCNIIKTDQWELSTIQDALLDEYENTVLETSKTWDPALQQFVEDYKYKAEFEYNSFGQVTKYDVYILEKPMEEWGNYRKEENDYDVNGNKTRTESYYWNLTQNKWIGNSKIEQSFNDNGSILNSINYQWDDVTDSWQNVAKTANTYNDSGKLTSNANYNWNNSLQKWIGENKNETVYNALDEEIKTIEYAWDSKSDEWKVSAINLAGYYDDLYNADGKITAHVYVTWNETINEWSAAEKYYYFYSLHSIISTSLTETLSSNQFVEVYPNPATDYICVRALADIKNGTIYIYNNNGQKVKTLKTVGDVTNINVNDLPAGNYFLRFATDKGVFVKNIIVR